MTGTCHHSGEHGGRVTGIFSFRSAQHGSFYFSLKIMGFRRKQIFFLKLQLVYIIFKITLKKYQLLFHKATHNENVPLPQKVQQLMNTCIHEDCYTGNLHPRPLLFNPDVIQNSQEALLLSGYYILSPSLHQSPALWKTELHRKIADHASSEKKMNFKIEHICSRKSYMHLQRYFAVYHV